MRQKIVRQCISLETHHGCFSLSEIYSFWSVKNLWWLKRFNTFEQRRLAFCPAASPRFDWKDIQLQEQNTSEMLVSCDLNTYFFRPAPVESVTPSRLPSTSACTEVNLQNTGKYVLCDVSELCALLADSHRVRAIFIFDNLRLKCHLKSWTCSSTSTLNIINNESIYYNHFILSFAGACKVIQSCKTCRDAQYLSGR